jgi:hypothetical protein
MGKVKEKNEKLELVTVRRLTSRPQRCIKAPQWRIGRCPQRQSPDRVPIRMRGEDKQRAAPPRAKLGKSGPLIGTL